MRVYFYLMVVLMMSLMPSTIKANEYIKSIVGMWILEDYEARIDGKLYIRNPHDPMIATLSINLGTFTKRAFLNNRLSVELNKLISIDNKTIRIQNGKHPDCVYDFLYSVEYDKLTTVTGNAYCKTIDIPHTMQVWVRLENEDE
jgi:hypothetical protein